MIKPRTAGALDILKAIGADRRLACHDAGNGWVRALRRIKMMSNKPYSDDPAYCEEHAPVEDRSLETAPTHISEAFLADYLRSR